MSGFHLAQINIGRLLAPIDAPEIADFANNLDRINAVAEGAPGFVWRLTGEGNNATDLQAFDDPLIIANMSVWTDMASLGAFVYRSGHIEIMRRREFFEAPTEAFQALWWVPAGQVPTLEEGVERLMHLRANGPTAFAFTFKLPFPPAADASEVNPILDECA